MVKIGEIIRKRREGLGLKVYELAEKVGVNPVYITQIEKHNKLPSPAIFLKILESLSLPADELNDLYQLYMKEKFPEILKFNDQFNKQIFTALKKNQK
jgi:transcriptional regulator with XRE-family HTH domain